jgi:hypothetical protein
VGVFRGVPLVDRRPSRGSPLLSGEGRPERSETAATLPGTGDAGSAIAYADWPILWRAKVTLGRRNARKGVG